MNRKISYTQQGDYLIPNLTLPEQDSRPIGIWGKRHLPILWVQRMNNASQIAREIVSKELIYT